MKRFLLCLTLCVCSAVFAGAWSTEEIEQFYSSAAVKEDSSVTVTETIVVRADGDKIRRGIFRVLPYRGVSGYQIVSVSRDGKPEPYSVESSPSGKTVYIGDANRILSPGRYIYKLSYTVTGAVRFQKDFDEFYWNVTGNDWQFPIDAAYFRLSLPAGAKVVPGGVSFYTGLAGAQDQNARELKELFFGTTRPLDSGEGLTVSVAWNKGIVKEPPLLYDIYSRFGYRAVIFMVLAWVCLLIYYMVVWRWVGKDPKARILRRFTPPEGLSPAQVRYVRLAECDRQMFSVVLLALVQKGYVKAEKTGTYDFKLTRLTPPEGVNLSSEEQACWDALFKKADSLQVTKKFGDVFLKAQAAVYNSLKKWAGKRFYRENIKYNTPTYWFAAVWIFFMVTRVPMQPFVNVENSMVVILCLAVLNAILVKLKVCKQAWLTLLGVLFWLYGWKWGVLSACVFAPGIIFSYLIPAYTVLGRQKMDEIEGFLQYLEVAETNRVFASNPTDAMRIYCNYLPYAVALGVQNEWWYALTAELGEASALQEVEVELGMVGKLDDWENFVFILGNASVSSSSGVSFSSSSSFGSSSSSSSDSGFGGGGCSGGGSGGGGGGGW